MAISSVHGQDQSGFISLDCGLPAFVFLSTSVVVFLSTPVWCSLPSSYGPSFHLCVVAPPSVLFLHHLCVVSSPHYWVGLFHTQNSDLIPKSQNSYPPIFPINPSQLSCPKSQNSYPLIIPKSRKFDQGRDLLCTSVGLVGSLCTAVLCRSWGLVVGIAQFHRLVSGSTPLLVRLIFPLLFAVIVLGCGPLVVLGWLSCQAVVSFNLSMRLLAWNCRGIGRDSKVRALKELIRASNLDLVFLSETKIQAPRINRIKTRLNFSDCFYVEANGRAGVQLCFGEWVLIWR